MNLLLLLVLGTLWGSSYLFIKIAVAEVPALTLVAGRLTLATLIMVVILRARGLSMPRARRTWGAFALLGFFNAALPYTLISWGEQYISSGLAALLTSTTPIFTVILAQFLSSDERITPARAAGVAIGFAGVGLLMLPEFLRQGVRASLWGQLAVIAATLCYAGMAIYARQSLRGTPALVLSTGQLVTSAVFAIPLSLLIDRPFDIAPSLPALGSWLGLTLLGTVLAYLIYFTLLERTSATFVTMVTYIIPVNGLFLGALVLHEPVQLTVAGSLGLILLGILLVRR